MLQTISKSFFLLISLVIVTCGIYPFALWMMGQTFFPFQANGSLLYDAKQKLIGSQLIAQPFTKEEYFQPRPSAAGYDASASTSSALAPSNYALRDRVARTLGPIVKYQNGQPVAPDIEKWFQQDKSRITATWAKQHPDIVAQFIKDHHPNIAAVFFDMWRQEHPDVILQDVPGDYVTTSGSGLDPHISLKNAEFQLDRVANKWASLLHRNPNDIRNEIEALLQAKLSAPFGGLAGEQYVNVLEINLELNKRYLFDQK